MYGPYTNETLVGKALKPFRDKVIIATKFGIQIENHKQIVTSDLKQIRFSLEGSLKRLQIDCYGSGIIVIFLCVMFLFEPRAKKAKETTAKDSMKNNVKESYKILFPVYFIGFFIMVAYYLAEIEFPHYIEDVLGLEPKYIGLAMALPTLSFGIFAFFYKYIAKFLSIKRIYIAALCVESFAFFLVFLVQNFAITAFAYFALALQED